LPVLFSLIRFCITAVPPQPWMVVSVIGIALQPAEFARQTCFEQRFFSSKISGRRREKERILQKQSSQ
jgi:hypothetical protein